MDDEIQVISDGRGLAILGDPAAVDSFLSSAGLASKDMTSPRLAGVLGAGAGVTQVAAEAAATSGRWVQLTKESAALVDKLGLRESATSGLRTGVLKGPKGQIKGFVEFAKASPSSLLTNPAVLSGAAGIMAQLAMQQAMDEITAYLERIDEKVDDILRAQKDAVLSEMIGVGLVIEEALTLRESVGRVTEVIWSKVRGVATTIARTQAYALRQIDALAEKLEKRDMGDLASAALDAQRRVQEWLAVLARCFQLHEALAVLELDRVFETEPAELDRHRVGLLTARQHRLDVISRSTETLLSRIDAAVATANAKVLVHPGKCRSVVQSSNKVAVAVVDFDGLLGIDRTAQSWEHARWSDAAAAKRDKALDVGAQGVDAAKRVGAESLAQVRSVKGRIAERGLLRRGGDVDPPQG